LDLQDGTLTVVVVPVELAVVVVPPTVVVVSMHNNYENRPVNNMKGCRRILLHVDDDVVLVELITVEDAI